MGALSERLQGIVDGLGLEPGDEVLEIGCGHGIAAAAICERLQDGHLLAIDRSSKMIEAASKRNAEHVAAGKAEFVLADLEGFDPDERRFDVILAVRVGLFHREPELARGIVEPWLAPGGRLVAVFDEPG